MALIGDMEYLAIGDKEYRVVDNTALHSVPIANGSTVGGVKGGGSGISIAADGTISATATGGGTVTSVRVQATSPVQSSQSTAQTTTLNTTISLADGYGDTKNPYGSKTANTVLAGPSTGNASAPTFRSLVADDIPDLSGSYATATHTHGNITNDGKLQTTDVTIATGDKLVVTDASNSNKIARTSISFDTGTGNTAKYLSKAGTWVDIPQGTAYTAGSGLTLSGTEFNHSNSITAVTAPGVYDITIDAQGHIDSYNGPMYISGNVTGISIADHTTGSVTGVQSSTTSVRGVKTGTNSTTTASKVTVGSSATDYGVTAVGSGSFTSGAFSGGSFSATVTNHVLSYSFTPATHGADTHTHTAPTLGSKVPTVSASDVTVPIRADSDVTVPIKDSSATTVVTGKTHSITDNGHDHLLTNGIS